MKPEQDNIRLSLTHFVLSLNIFLNIIGFFMLTFVDMFFVTFPENNQFKYLYPKLNVKLKILNIKL